MQKALHVRLWYAFFLASLMTLTFGSNGAPPVQAARAMPKFGQSLLSGTSILNENAIIAQNNLPQPQWFKDTIPFFDSPDANINGVYYYRWDSYREHLRATPTGYVSTEFASADVSWQQAPYGPINDSAGYQIYEGRWLRDNQYLNDFENFWLRGQGLVANRQYSEMLSNAIYNRYLVNGDASFITALLPDMIRLYNAWSDHYTANVNGSNQGLYYITPLLDATENTESSYHTCNNFSGGEGYRPTINAFQYANANAISNVAHMVGDTADANTFASDATAIKQATQNLLWNPTHNFFTQVFTNNTCNQSWANKQATWREEMGYVPWAFNLPDAQYSSAWQYLMNPNYFYAPYGPATDERQNDFEAEDPSTTVVNHANIHTSPSASNGGYVGQIDYPDSYVRFTVWAPYAGTYPVKVFYANNSTDSSGNHLASTHNVIVNGNTNAPMTVNYPNTGAWGQFAPSTYVTINVPLQAGSNTIEFDKGNNYAELDKITTNPYFNQDAIPPSPTPTNDANCCHWDGPSWPFDTTSTLMGLANLLDNYPAQNYISAANYFTLLENYATTQHKNGQPYVAEAADEDNPRWIYDQTDHSEDYNHSTFNDLVISGLVGIRPRSDNTFQLSPLVPGSWNYFCLENVPYHGHLMTILWDRDGSHYGHGSGLQIFQDNSQIYSSPTLGNVTVSMAVPIAPTPTTQMIDVAANPIAANEVDLGQSITQPYPQPFASFTNPNALGNTGRHDNVWQAIDGMAFYKNMPDNRWTNYTSPNSSDSLGVNFGYSRPVNEVNVDFYSDSATNGSIRAPASYDVQYWNGSAWVDVPNQIHVPAQPVANDQNIVTFNQVDTSQLRVVMTNQSGYYVGVTELESWYPQTFSSNASFTLTNQNSGQKLDINSASTSNGGLAIQATASGSTSQQWAILDAGGGYYKIQNVNSGKVLGVVNESTADNTPIVQFDDNGTPDHLWQILNEGNGFYKIINQNSGKVLGVVNASTSSGAQVVQFSDTGATDHNWSITSLAAPVVKIQDLNSGKVLGVTNESTADSAQVVQFDDNGTPDHNWQLLSQGGGYYKIKNLNSGKVLGVTNESTADNAQVVQFDDNGTPDHLWIIIDTGGGYYKIENVNSLKVLAVLGASTADSAQVVQFNDIGAPDQRWTFVTA